VRECERQITSAVTVVAVAAIVFVVVAHNGIDVNGCVASTSAPVVHVLPGQGWRRYASSGDKVFPRGQQQRQSSNNSRLLN
jgi:hypothetical protein